MTRRFLFILTCIALTAFPALLAAQQAAPPTATAPAKQTAEPIPSNLSFFPLVPPGSAPGALPGIIPIANNHPLGGTHPGLTRVVIGLHDSSRNAQGMLAILSTLAGPANDKILIVVPQFMAAADSERFYQDIPPVLRHSFVFWPMDAWEDGGESAAEEPQRGISSFTVMDLILVYLAQKDLFPDVKEIVIAGHGGGADFVQRYAAMGAATDVVEKQGISIRFLIANASTYLYLTNARPRTDSIGFAAPNGSSCSKYNYYKYGLEELNNYGRHVGANAIKTAYGDRNITYIMGEDAGAADPFPDDSCAAMFEGPNRVMRGVSYGMYLYGLFGESITARQKSVTIPRTGYDPVPLLGSACGLSVLFGNGECGPTPVKNP